MAHSQWCAASTTRRLLLFGCVLISLPWPALAQTATEREQGLRDATPRWHVLTEARLVVAPGRVIENGMLVLKDGLVVAAGPASAIPDGARVWRLPGRTVYPGFIDLASTIGVPAALRPQAPARPRWGPGSELPEPKEKPPEPRPLAARAMAASNAFVRPEQDVAQQLEWKADDARAARALGFTAVLAAPAAGVFRGQGVLLALGDAKDPKLLVIAPRVAQHTAFDIDRSREPGYPTSMMGSVALAGNTAVWPPHTRRFPSGQTKSTLPSSTVSARSTFQLGRFTCPLPVRRPTRNAFDAHGA